MTSTLPTVVDMTSDIEAIAKWAYIHGTKLKGNKIVVCYLELLDLLITLT